jgi:hypothetical protein
MLEALLLRRKPGGIMILRTPSRSRISNTDHELQNTFTPAGSIETQYCFSNSRRLQLCTKDSVKSIWHTEA